MCKLRDRQPTLDFGGHGDKTPTDSPSGAPQADVPLGEKITRERRLAIVEELGSLVVRKPTAWEELNGLDPEAEARKDVLGVYGEFLVGLEHGKKPDKKEIRTFFERFALLDLTPDNIEAMKADDRSRLFLHLGFHYYLSESRARVFRTPGVDVVGQSATFSSYGFDTEAQANEYGFELHKLLQTIRELPLYTSMTEANAIPKNNHEYDARRKRVERDTRQHGGGALPYVTKNNKDRLGIEYRRTEQPDRIGVELANS